ncbi:MAG TPA: YncE family protein [Thermoanaerobaculia bacterium]|jgi:DNA-binding beta-propeller fold protein YncE|nr:YncE family protein [Thermoanaerobaculia bacterium]
MKWLPALLLILGCASTPPASVPHYHVVRHIPLGGEGGWDYLTVDPVSRHIFVSHATEVVVVDADSGKVVGHIPKTEGVHGIALAPELHRGFISNGRSSTMTVFDPATLRTIDEVKTTGERPDAILYDPATERVFTFNAGGKNTTAFDATTNAVAGTIDLGGKPEFAQADGQGRVFVNIEDTSEIVAIDSKALKVVNRWKLAPCEEPSGLAFDRAHHRLFSGCDNEVMAVSDADAGRVVTTVPIGKGVDANAFDDSRQLAFSSNGASATLTIVAERSPDQYDVLENLPTKRGARTMAFDRKTGHIFLATADFGPPPAPTAERPNPRPPVLPNTFELIEVAP